MYGATAAHTDCCSSIGARAKDGFCRRAFAILNYADREGGKLRVGIRRGGVLEARCGVVEQVVTKIWHSVPVIKTDKKTSIIHEILHWYMCIVHMLNYDNIIML